MVKFVDLTEDIEINEVNLSIDTFYMRKDEYNALSEVNRKIAHEYIDSIARGMKPKSEATVRYNGLIMRFMLWNVVNELDKLETSIESSLKSRTLLNNCILFYATFHC